MTLTGTPARKLVQCNIRTMSNAVPHGWFVAAGGLLGGCDIGGSGGRVVGPVTAGGVDPVNCCPDGDAEHVGENHGGDLGGELGLSGPSCCSGVDAEDREALTESQGGDRSAGQMTGEQPATLGDRTDPDVVCASGANQHGDMGAERFGTTSAWCRSERKHRHRCW